MKIEITYCLNYWNYKMSLSVFLFWVSRQKFLYSGIKKTLFIIQSPIFPILIFFSNLLISVRSTKASSNTVREWIVRKKWRKSSLQGHLRSRPRRGTGSRSSNMRRALKMLRLENYLENSFVKTSEISGRNTSADESANSDWSEEARQTEDRKQIFK